MSRNWEKIKTFVNLIHSFDTLFMFDDLLCCYHWLVLICSQASYTHFGCIDLSIQTLTVQRPELLKGHPSNIEILLHLRRYLQPHLLQDLTNVVQL